MKHLAVSVALTLTFASPAFAQDATFDFEDQSAYTPVTSVSITDNGLTLDLSRSGATFEFDDETPYYAIGVPTSYGARTLSPFEDFSGYGFLLNFSSALSGFGLDFGDAGGDVDTYSFIGWSGLNGTGSAVFTLTGTLPETDFDFHPYSTSISGTLPFLSVTLSGGSDVAPQSIYYDNFTATFAAVPGVPEPATWALMIAGFGAVGFTMRRKRSTQRAISAAA